MRDFVVIGPCPSGEVAVNTRDPDYHDKALGEAWEFIELIRRVVGVEPEGAQLSVRAWDFPEGRRYGVVCYWDDETPGSFTYAMRSRDYAPSTWDAANAKASRRRLREASV